jgi:hypothetical protein
MRSKIGSTILACLLYSQALFGFAAIGAVMMKDRAGDSASALAPVAVASVAGTVVR